jgi:hypothetical protein
MNPFVAPRERRWIATSSLLVAILLTSCLTSCGLIGPVGDLTREVRIRNRMNIVVVEFSYGRRDPRYRERMAPGESVIQTWMYPISAGDSRKRRVEADSEDGKLVFCTDIGYSDLSRQGWVVDIVAGHTECPSE